jgi:arsenate reductase
LEEEVSIRRRVLFLCTGNSVRSQIAEALTKARFPEWEAFSAGVRPTGSVHPMAVQVLKEIGIEHHGKSKSVDQFRDQEFDRVVTVCDGANEECPVWLGKGRRLHESFRDPSSVVGSDAERLAAFRQARDAISAKLPELLE